MKFVANGHVHETGKRLTEIIEATNASKARILAQHWTFENGLVFDGIETQDEHNARTGAHTGPLVDMFARPPARTENTERERLALLLDGRPEGESSRLALLLVDQVARGVHLMLEDAIAGGAFAIELDAVKSNRDGDSYILTIEHGTTPIISLTVEAV